MNGGLTACAASACVVIAGSLAWMRAEEVSDDEGLTEPYPRVEERRQEAASASIESRMQSPIREDRSLARQLYKGGSVTVGGHVQSPGKVACSRTTTLKRAIESAGGATPFGTVKRVRLIRAGKLYEFDLRQANPSEIEVLPGDVITVPEKMIFGR